ncbi:unnamed protein product [Amoebophrya sp. A120]|nr:unnamed protein product [Amoebophrya sp. A120]|eukprot:GSA120T00025526001.1
MLEQETQHLGRTRSQPTAEEQAERQLPQQASTHDQVRTQNTETDDPTKQSLQLHVPPLYDEQQQLQNQQTRQQRQTLQLQEQPSPDGRATNKDVSGPSAFTTSAWSFDAAPIAGEASRQASGPYRAFASQLAPCVAAIISDTAGSTARSGTSNQRTQESVGVPHLSEDALSAVVRTALTGTTTIVPDQLESPATQYTTLSELAHQAEVQKSIAQFELKRKEAEDRWNERFELEEARHARVDAELEEERSDNIKARDQRRQELAAEKSRYEDVERSLEAERDSVRRRRLREREEICTKIAEATAQKRDRFLSCSSLREENRSIRKRTRKRRSELAELKQETQDLDREIGELERQGQELDQESAHLEREIFVAELAAEEEERLAREATSAREQREQRKREQEEAQRDREAAEAQQREEAEPAAARQRAADSVPERETPLR